MKVFTLVSVNYASTEVFQTSSVEKLRDKLAAFHGKYQQYTDEEFTDLYQYLKKNIKTYTYPEKVNFVWTGPENNVRMVFYPEFPCDPSTQNGDHVVIFTVNDLSEGE